MSKYITTVLICDDVPDSHGDTFLLEGVSFSEKALPIVYFDKNLPVGKAFLKKESNSVVAEIEIDDIFGLSLTSYCCVVGGVILNREDNIIKQCTITTAILTDSPSDKRLSKLRKV